MTSPALGEARELAEWLAGVLYDLPVHAVLELESDQRHSMECALAAFEERSWRPLESDTDVDGVSPL